jgi:hypothetical protein
MSLTREQIENALSVSGGRVKEAAQVLDVPLQKMYYNIRVLGIPFRNQKVLINTTELKSLYEKYQSLSLVAKELGCSSEGVRNVMSRCGFQINEPIRYSFNERFFSEDSEKTFYWGGFLGADGGLKKHRNSDVLDLGLAIKDKYHLETFKQDIEATHPIHEYIVKNSKRNPKWQDCKKAEIKLVSKYLPDDLARFNIVPRKTHIYKFPDWMFNNKLLNHFMRGYFDGDGSWYVGSSKKTDQFFFSLRGTPEFLTMYRSILEERCGLQERTKDIRMNCGIGILEYGGNGVAVKIRDFLYKDAKTFLQRKYDKVKDVIVVERLQVTPDVLIQMMHQFGEQKKIAEALGCSESSITRYVNLFGIRDQMREAKHRH